MSSQQSMHASSTTTTTKAAAAVEQPTAFAALPIRELKGKLDSLRIDYRTVNERAELESLLQRALTDRANMARNWQSHRNADRPKTWLAYHAELRRVGQIMLEMAEEVVTLATPDKDKASTPAVPPAVGRTEVAKKAQRLERQFQVYHSGLQSHGHFEDTQLFKFFRDQFAREFGSVMTELSEDHAQSDAAASQLKRRFGRLAERQYCVEDLRSIRAALELYVNDLLAHLLVEEQAVLPLWLSMPESLQQKLRHEYIHVPTAPPPQPARRQYVNCCYPVCCNH